MNKVLVVCLILAAVVVVIESSPCLKQIKSQDSGCDSDPKSSQHDDSNDGGSDCGSKNSQHDDSNDGGSDCGSEKKAKKHKSKPCD